MDSKAFTDQSDQAPPDQQIDTQAFAGAWTTTLIKSMEKHLDEKTITTILEDCGRACAQILSSERIKADQINLDDLLAKMKELWLESVDHDETIGQIKLIGNYDTCPCPIHPAEGTNIFCECTNGLAKELFFRATGKPVKVQLDESILRGQKRCSWTISYTPN
jgi:predicted ArsR family transcriptional regulator